MALRRSSAVPTLLLLLALDAFGCRREAAQAPVRETRSPAATTADAGQDRLMVDSIERHYAATVALARLVETRTSRDVVRKFARDLIADAQREAASARSLHDRLGADDRGAGWIASQDFQRIASLQGVEFEAAFAPEIRKHLQDGLEKGTDAAGSATNKDVRTLGQHLVDHDRRYLGRLNELDPSENR